MVRRVSDRDTSEAMLAHSNEGVAKFYTNHNWDRLGEALDPTTGRGVVPPGGSRRPRKNPWRRFLAGAGARAGRR